MDNQGQQELIVLDTFEPAVAFDPAKRDESRRRFSMFLVQSEAGQGGTGVVQRATNTAGEIFAIKRLHVSDTTDERIAAGMRAVLVYDEASAHRHGEAEALVERVIHDFTELTAELDGAEEP